MSDWDGAAYRDVNTLQQWLADRALTGLELDGVGSLLDVGCGDGRITATIAARIPAADVVGLDPSPRVLSVAPTAANLTFELVGVESMDHADRFDAVVSFNALHWVPDQARALTRIAAALRPRGRALLVLVCGGPRPSVEDAAMTVAASPRWVEHFAGFGSPFVHPDPQAWARLAAEAGLTITSSHVEDLAWEFGSRKAFARWCAVGFGAWTERLPAGAALPFATDVAAAYERIGGAPGRFRFLQLRAELVRPPPGQ